VALRIRLYFEVFIVAVGIADIPSKYVLHDF
jgi:hypothetical protein